MLGEQREIRQPALARIGLQLEKDLVAPLEVVLVGVVLAQVGVDAAVRQPAEADFGPGRGRREQRGCDQKCTQR